MTVRQYSKYFHEALPLLILCSTVASASLYSLYSEHRNRLKMINIHCAVDEYVFGIGWKNYSFGFEVNLYNTISTKRFVIFLPVSNNPLFRRHQSFSHVYLFIVRNDRVLFTIRIIAIYYFYLHLFDIPTQYAVRGWYVYTYYVL